MSAIRLALAAAALVIAAAAALLAADIASWEKAFRTGDAEFAAGQRGSWDADTRLGGLSRRLLAVGDDREARRSIALFRAARIRGLGFGGGLERQGARSAAEGALADVVQGADSATAAQASVLLGVLLFGDPASGGREGPTPAERALAAFDQALRLDPRNDDAAYDVELVLRLLEARGERPGTNPGAGPRAGGRRGAGAGTPGRGY